VNKSTIKNNASLFRKEVLSNVTQTNCLWGRTFWITIYNEDKMPCRVGYHTPSALIAECLIPGCCCWFRLI